jgi:hypothetical protein
VEPSSYLILLWAAGGRRHSGSLGGEGRCADRRATGLEKLPDEKRRQETIAKIRELARSIHVGVKIEGHARKAA